MANSKFKPGDRVRLHCCDLMGTVGTIDHRFAWVSWSNGTQTKEYVSQLRTWR